LQVLIESERIHIPKTLSTAENLVEELLDFDIDVDEATGKPTYGAIRPGTHDDMVVALGLAVLPDLYDGLNLEGLRFVTGGGSRIRFPDTAYRGDWFDEAARHHGW
ncbi:MAG TPA: hypothetical protein PLU88_14570, partial [Armatimonadota bacterium]|nr:hypothetical protein [Armatimonadota bacterium]